VCLFLLWFVSAFSHKIMKTFFQEDNLYDHHYHNLKEVENYGEKTVSSINYLILESLGKSDFIRTVRQQCTQGNLRPYKDHLNQQILFYYHLFSGNTTICDITIYMATLPRSQTVGVILVTLTITDMFNNNNVFLCASIPNQWFYITKGLSNLITVYNVCVVNT